MAKQNKKFERRLDRYTGFLVDKLGISSDKALLARSIMDGTYKNGSGNGSKTYNGQGVNTYEGRIKAVKDLLNLNSSKQYKSIERLINSNDYLSKTKSKNSVNEGAYRSDLVKNYTRGLFEGAVSVEKKLGNYVEGLKNLRTANGILNSENSVLTKEVSGLSSLLTVEKGNIATEKTKSKKWKRRFKQAIVGGVLASVLTAVGTYALLKPHQKVEKNTSVVETNYISDSSDSYGGIVLDVAFPEEKSSDLNSIVSGAKEGGLESLVTNNTEVSSTVTTNGPTITKVKTITKDDGKGLKTKLTQIEKKTDLSNIKSPSNLEDNLVPSNTNLAEVVSLNSSSEYDSGFTYVNHVNKRNPQIDSKGDITLNPFKGLASIGNHFENWGKQIVDTEDLGYSSENYKKRGSSIGNGLKSVVSILPFVNLNKEDLRKREDNNFLQRGFMKVYQALGGAGSTVVNTTDLATGGLAEKLVVDVVGGGVVTTVDSLVETAEWVASVPIAPAQEIENWASNNDGRFSRKVYEGVTSLLRFGGNVVLREAVIDGKYAEIITKDGKVVEVDKGGFGTLMESLVVAGIDGWSASKVGDSNNSNVSGESVENHFNQGTGGNIGN